MLVAGTESKNCRSVRPLLPPAVRFLEPQTDFCRSLNVSRGWDVTWDVTLPEHPGLRLCTAVRCCQVVRAGKCGNAIASRHISPVGSLAVIFTF